MREPSDFIKHPADEWLSHFHVPHHLELAERIRAHNPNGIPEGKRANGNEVDLLACINHRNAFLGDQPWTMENMHAMEEFCLNGTTTKKMPPPSRHHRQSDATPPRLPPKDEAVVRLLKKIAASPEPLKWTETFEDVCAFYGLVYTAKDGLIPRKQAAQDETS